MSGQSDQLNASESRTILAVDDESDILNLYDTFFSLKGYNVITLNDPSSVMDTLAQEKVDLIVLDINMPDINGLELLREVRYADSQISIVMITGRADKESVRKAAQYGADNFVLKPFSFEDLAKRIEIEFYRVTPGDLRDQLGGLGEPNRQVLTEPGMKEYDDLAWNPFPIEHEGHQLCLMLPRGIKPEGVNKVPEHELKKSIRILHRHPLRWKRVWPWV